MDIKYELAEKLAARASSCRASAPPRSRNRRTLRAADSTAGFSGRLSRPSFTVSMAARNSAPRPSWKRIASAPRPVLAKAFCALLSAPSTFAHPLEQRFRAVVDGRRGEREGHAKPVSASLVRIKAPDRKRAFSSATFFPR